MIEFLKGKKTYLIAFGAAVYGAGIQTGLWPHWEFLDYLLAGAGAAALRAGIAKSPSTLNQESLNSQPSTLN